MIYGHFRIVSGSRLQVCTRGAVFGSAAAVEQHILMGGKLHLHKRMNSSFWQCWTYLKGKKRYKSTKQEHLQLAIPVAENWFIDLRGRAQTGNLHSGPTFRKAAKKFLEEYLIITEGQRSPEWVRTLNWMIKVHLLPFFGDMALTAINPGKLQDYRIHRRETAMQRIGRPPARESIKKEIVAVRMVLKTALRHNWLQFLPDFSIPYKTSGKIVHRAWFSPDEYIKLYTATRKRAQNPKHHLGRWRFQSEQLHDFVLFMANTGLRPDEAYRLEFRDVQVIKEPGSKEPILHIEVRGKRGIRYCKSTAKAVFPFERLKKRLRPAKASSSCEGPSLIAPQATDKIFPSKRPDILNAVLNEEGLKRDRDGQVRTAYSLRHSYACFRLLEGADYWALAKNMGTSPEMIDQFYGSHLKNRLDAAAINVDRGNIARERRQQKQLA